MGEEEQNDIRLNRYRPAKIGIVLSKRFVALEPDVVFIKASSEGEDVIFYLAGKKAEDLVALIRAVGSLLLRKDLDYWQECSEPLVGIRSLDLLEIAITTLNVKIASHGVSFAYYEPSHQSEALCEMLQDSEYPFALEALEHPTSTEFDLIVSALEIFFDESGLRLKSALSSNIVTIDEDSSLADLFTLPDPGADDPSHQA